MSNTVVLRSVYALNSNTGKFISSGQVLYTDGLGGTYWSSIVNGLAVIADGGGPGGIGGSGAGAIFNNFPSTINYFSTQIYYNIQYFGGVSAMSTDMYNAISSLSVAITNTAGTVSKYQLISTAVGLGTLGYVSTPTLSTMIASSIQSGYISPSTMSTIIYNIGGSTFQTVNSTMTSLVTNLSTNYNIVNLSTINIITNNTINSTFVGLGSGGYISTISFFSTIIHLGDAGYVSSASLASTVKGLGTSGYVSTQSLVSSIIGLGTVSYISTPSLVSSVQGLYNAINVGFSTVVNASTIAGLGTLGYISTGNLVSTTYAMSIMKTAIRFDYSGNVTPIGGYNTFINVTNLVFVSTFFTSSLQFSGNQGTQINSKQVGLYDMCFSTASIDFTPFSSFMDSNSRLTLDIYPTIAFSKVGTGATGPVVLAMSTFLQQDNTVFSTTTVTSFVTAANTRMFLENGTFVDSSNFYTTPIKMAIPQGIVSSFASPYSLIHYLPNGMNDGQYQTALHSTCVTPYFASTGSLYLSIQNHT